MRTLVGEHVVVDEGYSPAAPGYVMSARCKHCGATTEDVLDQPDRYAAANAARFVENFIAAHRHLPPKPLTAEERERVRIVGIHRRGALRCGYGGSA